LTKDTGKIREALQRSELVEVHPADDKLKKKRFVTTAADSDRKTVYIEGFALNDNHDTLAKRFSAIGNVILVFPLFFSNYTEFVFLFLFG
jgi:hypothetical protein